MEEKAARLKHEGLGKIKIALAGCNTSSLLDTLEGTFGFVDQENISTASTSEMKEPTKEVSLSSFTLSSKESALIGAELFFPMQTIPFVVAEIPESLLPLCGPETQSHYRCQFPDCVQVFSQKAAACTHIHQDHLNVALACLYCSGKEILRYNGSVPQLGKIMSKNILKMASLYSWMTLLFLTCFQRLYPQLLVPPLNLFYLKLFWIGPKQLNNV